MQTPSLLLNCHARQCTVQELQGAGLLASEEQPEPRLPTVDDLQGLPYLNAVFHEGVPRRLAACGSDLLISIMQNVPRTMYSLEAASAGLMHGLRHTVSIVRRCAPSAGQCRVSFACSTTACAGLMWGARKCRFSHLPNGTKWHSSQAGKGH